MSQSFSDNLVSAVLSSGRNDMSVDMMVAQMLAFGAWELAYTTVPKWGKLINESLS